MVAGWLDGAVCAGVLVVGVLLRGALCVCGGYKTSYQTSSKAL